MKKHANELLEVIKQQKNENSEGIVYLISNMDTLKYISLGNPIDERREAIIKHVLDIYPSTNRSTIEHILTKNFVFSNQLFTALSLVPTLLSFGFSICFFYTTKPLYNYNPTENIFANLFGMFFMYVIPAAFVAFLVKLLFLYISFCTPAFPRTYGIKKEYKALGIPSKKLYEIK